MLADLEAQYGEDEVLVKARAREIAWSFYAPRKQNRFLDQAHAEMKGGGSGTTQ